MDVVWTWYAHGMAVIWTWYGSGMNAHALHLYALSAPVLPCTSAHPLHLCSLPAPLLPPCTSAPPPAPVPPPCPCAPSPRPHQSYRQISKSVTRRKPATRTQNPTSPLCWPLRRSQAWAYTRQTGARHSGPLLLKNRLTQPRWTLHARPTSRPTMESTADACVLQHRGRQAERQSKQRVVSGARCGAGTECVMVWRCCPLWRQHRKHQQQKRKTGATQEMRKTSMSKGPEKQKDQEGAPATVRAQTLGISREPPGDNCNHLGASRKEQTVPGGLWDLLGTLKKTSEDRSCACN